MARPLDPNVVTLVATIGQSAVPEPASLMMLVVGLSGLGIVPIRRALTRRSRGQGA